SNLLVTPGVRLEYVHSQRETLRNYVDGQPKDISLKDHGDSITPLPGIGIVYGSPSAHVFGGLHIGYAAPRFTTPIRAEKQRTELAAEHAIHYELGTRLSRKRQLRFEVTGFLSSFQNQVVSTSDADTGGLGLTNGGPTRHLGVESAATVGFGDLFKLGM